jgi:hypothetical protein
MYSESSQLLFMWFLDNSALGVCLRLAHNPDASGSRCVVKGASNNGTDQAGHMVSSVAGDAGLLWAAGKSGA